MKVQSLRLIPLALVAILTGCTEPVIELASAQSLNLDEHSPQFSAKAYIEHNEVYNAESVIPPQCYTKTDGVHNPCYACHQTYSKDTERPNQMRDGDLQGTYEFSDLGIKNHWRNLFIDRTELISSITDQDITNWVNTDNYTPFIQKQKSNSDWHGEITPIENLAYPALAFDTDGFAKDGSGWVAFNYKPFPSTFWPTNGSTGDVMIRLPMDFQTRGGVYKKEVYLANLSLVELTLKGLTRISTPEIDENEVGVDLNQDGSLTLVTEILATEHYVGDTKAALAYQLYPEGTEFLHTVRYIGVDEHGNIYNASRMKEVRYMKKHAFKSKQHLASSYYREAKEKAFENLPQTLYLGDKGINNTFGWTINGYIEDEKGQLRQQHEQELAFCNGCHKTIGSTYDQTFSFARKVTGKKGWGYINLKSMRDVPNKGQTQGEFLTYMQRVGGGDEFRQNQEMLARWFKSDGSLDVEKVRSSQSLYDLITPSPTRAQSLNKAYLTIVKEQSYLFGRDATLVKAHNVLTEVDETQHPLEPEHRYVWDLQLDWNADQNITNSKVKMSK
ncbi:hypothetical protein NI389_19610 (plasmid) [Pseudoalteromonas xiamenensis]|uniref:hypothetical protein n=1 Tax=Pseudoalteromonas xiamenensis TaxID=882626 RepID=UPI0027E4204E|nr:hypothetical protein [Pseudoalteromonas xiamenensis]WMN62298.1 hypothetical protein NI389_19610 [Pseudoalteromonas xiamenensis]